jgi:molybdopterin-guanine dinucleotide biosynthesis protein B
MKKYYKKVVAFSGVSNSGKTTLIVNLSKHLIEKKFKVCVVKHDPKNKAVVDTEGKDSYNFSQTGANVALVSNKKITIFKHNTNQKSIKLDEIISLFEEFDYLFIEGFKNLEIPRILVIRGENKKNCVKDNYYQVSNVIASDCKIDKSNLKILDLNNENQILDWIDNNALVV